MPVAGLPKTRALPRRIPTWIPAYLQGLAEAAPAISRRSRAEHGPSGSCTALRTSKNVSDRMAMPPPFGTNDVATEAAPDPNAHLT
ncbi:hypothetical protein [Nevskia sp.]|uniref:hypothetical protein n=1 Tax=Nevskia sp. TaxID=1929292 RepID=UPI0025FF735D|nr:hypothetical protein [Nevskia sp.]